MFSTYQPVDYSPINVEAECSKIDVLHKKLVERTGKSIDELLEISKRKAAIAKGPVTTASLIEIIKASNSLPRNSFTEHFLIKDMEDSDAVITFDGGQVFSGPLIHPGCIRYAPRNVVYDQDVEKLVTIADTCGMGVIIKGSDDLEREYGDLLVKAGFEADEHNYFCYGDYRTPSEKNIICKM